MVHSNVELRFIQLPYRRIHEVETCSHIFCIRLGIELHHRLTDRVDETVGNFGTGRSLRLTSISVDRQRQRIFVWIALKIDIVGGGGIQGRPGHIGIHNYRYRNWCPTRRLERPEYRVSECVIRVVPVSHRVAGQQSCKRDAATLKFLFAVDEEKCLVLSDWSANRPAKLIQVEFFRGRCEKALGVQRCVSQEFEQRAVEIVVPGLGGQQHRWTRASSVLRRVVICQDLKLLNGVDRREDGDAAGGQLVVVHSIDQPVRAIGPRTTDRKRERSAGSDLTGVRSGEKAVGVCLRRSSGTERRKLREIAPIQRELRNLLGGNDLAEGGIRGLHCHFVCYDFNRGTHGGGGQNEIQFALLIHLQFYILALHRREALEFHPDRIDGYRQQADDVVAHIIGLGFATCASALGGDPDGSSGNCRARFVCHRP